MKVKWAGEVAEAWTDRRTVNGVQVRAEWFVCVFGCGGGGATCDGARGESGTGYEWRGGGCADWEAGSIQKKGGGDKERAVESSWY